MKIRVKGHFANSIISESMDFSYARYIPYILLIILVKICVIGLAIRSYEMGDAGPSEVSMDDYGVAVFDFEKMHELTLQKQKQQIPSGGVEDPYQEEKQSILSHLNEVELRPSALNRTPTDAIWLFFNRIPRTGGTTLVSLLQYLGEELGYQHQEHEYTHSWERILTHEEQQHLARWFEYNLWPKSFDRFSLYINFTEHRSKYTRTKPAYLTMVRDPIDKFVSFFHSKRTDKDRARLEMKVRAKNKPGDDRKWYWQDINECILKKQPECNFKDDNPDPSILSSIPFFCGQHEFCLMHNNKEALQKAKFNLEYEYSVVGIVEHLNATLAAFEHYLPLFFKGASQRYWSEEFKHRHEKKSRKKIKALSDAAAKALRTEFAQEFELYEFAAQRLHKQTTLINQLNSVEVKLPPRKEAPKLMSPLDRFQVELRS